MKAGDRGWRFREYHSETAGILSQPAQNQRVGFPASSLSEEEPNILRTVRIIQSSAFEADANLKSYSMKFDGHLLNRGFWLYVWEIKGPLSHHVYIGRTGDSSSARASSPFRRIGQHLDPGPNAKGNALGKQLMRAGVKYDACSFEMVAIGPIWPEQDDFDAHKPIRDRMAALERAVADDLRQRGYSVLGTHPRGGITDEAILRQIRALLDPKFPGVGEPNKPMNPSGGAGVF